MVRQSKSHHRTLILEHTDAHHFRLHTLKGNRVRVAAQRVDKTRSLGDNGSLALGGILNKGASSNNVQKGIRQNTHETDEFVCWTSEKSITTTRILWM